MERQNMINGLATEPTLSNIFKRVGNTVSNGSDLQSRPIGIVGKNYNFLKNTLKRNIGTSIFDYDGYGTPIGMLADTDLTSESIPWFLMDNEKNRYDNYVRYINDTYYRGFMVSPNFMTQEEKTAIFNRHDWLLVNNQVGAIRGYNVYWTPSKDIQSQKHSPTNPNGFIDTQLGKINNFYLNATMKNAMLHKYQHDNEITSWAYGLFGFDGLKGIMDWNMFNGSNQSVVNGLLTDELIPYSSVEGSYGDYNKLSNSQGLIDSTSEKVRNYIYKSLYGYDLLSDINVIPSEDGAEYDHTFNTNKKYYSSVNGGKDYLSKITDGISYSYDTDSWDSAIRYNLHGIGHGLSDSRTIYTYAEAEYGNGSAYNAGTLGANYGINYGLYKPYNLAINGKEKSDIISYTNKKFINGKYDTIIGRFHTKTLSLDKDGLSSAVSQYGMSHGRNLLKADHQGSITNGYEDPYCRVWTFHKQYSRLVDTIRPFYDEEGTKKDLTQNGYIKSLQPRRESLHRNGAKLSNGLVRCAPTKDDEIKKCMFSIENLAWKNEINMMSGYEKGQRGPLGGRIMWFPPYDLSFSESVQVGWNPTQFIGRGENIYTYTNTERSGTLRFKLLIDHPSILNKYKKQGLERGDVDDTGSTEQQILRFFAGCDILEPPPTEQEEKPKEQPQLPKVETKIVETPQPKPKQVNFYVFFPNNYSGIDDITNGVIKPVEYLLNGFGAQKYVNGYISDGITADDTISKEFPTTYEQGGLGYEMDTSKHGISYITEKDYIGGRGNNQLVNMGGGYCHAPIRCLDRNKQYTNYWGYRVDKEYENQVLKHGENYRDNTSFGLNSENNYLELLSYHTDAQELANEGTLYSFATVAAAVDANYRQNPYLYEDSGLVDIEESDAIIELINTYKPSAVKVHGFASSHGTEQWNQQLSDNRAHTIMDWLHQCNPNKFDMDLLKCGKVAVGPEIVTEDVSSLDAKVWRCSKVTIEFIVDDISENGNPTASDETIVDTIAKTEIANTEQTSENQHKQASQEVNKTVKDSTVSGYNNEYEFFKELESLSPFLHHRIVDKIKYFDPAFHSITPEGFNSRLTFLHQCTRQGNTMSSSDIHSTTRSASNLSYGTPPICVLRIGDFYNTKIIIDSIQFNFDDTTWDLNDEGIGIMPMIANIDISFKFLGGSDLSGPIARLQNAASFNYYANTSVYDQRSETVVFDDKGNIMDIETKQ